MLRTRLLSLVVLAVAAGALVEADEVIIKGKEKEKPLKGKVTKESPKEITLAPAKEPIPTESIADIVYEFPPGGASIAYNAAVKAEQASLDPTKEKDRATKLKEAIDKYEEAFALPALTDKNLKRHVEYKVLMLRVRHVQEDDAKDPKLIAKLVDFAKKNPTAWQIINVCQTLGRMQIDAGDYEGAEDSYSKLAKIPGLSDDARLDATMLAIQAKIQGGKFEEARSDIAELQKDLPKGSRFQAKAQVAEAECLVAETKKLAKDDAKRAKLFAQATDLVRGVIKESSDKYVKAVGHNTLGYVYQEQGQTKDAVWEFLWVDVVYNQDRVQHAKALYHLWDLFSKDGDAPRAQECRETLMSPQFAGLEYQRLVQKESKAP